MLTTTPSREQGDGRFQETFSAEAELVAGSLTLPTAFAFLPDGSLLVAELSGTIRVVRDGSALPDPVIQLPASVRTEGGLVGMALHPNFRTNGLVYAFFTYQDNDQIFNRLVRFKVEGITGKDIVTLLDQIPGYDIHNGGVLTFGPDGKLYLSVGDTDRPYEAQDRATLLGKVHRLNDDGTIPQDNPFPGLSAYTLGHRNVFGLAFHPTNGMLYATENGPECCDELNLLLPGKNYGWPSNLGKTGNPRFQDPLLAMETPVAPTHAAFYTGDRLGSTLKGDLFFGAFTRPGLYRVKVSPSDPAQVLESGVYTTPGPVLALAQGPDGFLYFSSLTGIYRVTALSRRRTVVLDFAQANVNRYLGFGWYSPEVFGGRAYRWMDQKAEIFLPIPAGTGPATLEIRGTTVLDKFPAKEVALEILVGTVSIGSVTVKDIPDLFASFTVPPELMKGDELPVVLKASSFFVPNELEPEVLDFRRLSLTVSHITLSRPGK